jgi:photosynthetic reaction center cytochrome c subunit
MAAITAWVSPQEGCNYCHNAENLADDSKYTKVVARRMLQMTQHVNADWKDHVADTGVTCYTCHRGNAGAGQRVVHRAAGQASNFIGDRNGQNKARPRGPWA